MEFKCQTCRKFIFKDTKQQLSLSFKKHAFQNHQQQCQSSRYIKDYYREWEWQAEKRGEYIPPKYIQI